MEETMTQQPPTNLGNNLLIAMSNTSASLKLVEHVARHLPDPPHTRITLMHYLQPTMWEHGGDVESPEKLKEILETEDQQFQNEEREEERTERYFDQATAILQQNGVPEANIQTTIDWDDRDVAAAILDELHSGRYTAVAVGQHHHDILDRLLGGSLADTLRRHTENVALWTIQDSALRSNDQ